jgi:lipopolysaccharide transport system permease protein
MRNIWLYRGFILASVKREFQLKYRNSLLGVAWTIINPLCMIFIYTVIFSQVMKTRLSGVDDTFAYSIYLCSGIITWYFFTDMLNRAMTVFIDHASIIKKLYFPRVCLPIIVLLGSVLNFAIVFGLFTLFLCLTHHFPGWLYLALFPILAVQIAFTMGFGMCLGILNVFFRDVGQFFVLFLQIWFWFTPIVYSDSILPSWIQPYLTLNPMYPIINAYHAIFVMHQLPNWGSLYPVIILSFLCGLLALGLLREHGDEIVDEL